MTESLGSKLTTSPSQVTVQQGGKELKMSESQAYCLSARKGERMRHGVAMRLTHGSVHFGILGGDAAGDVG